MVVIRIVHSEFRDSWWLKMFVQFSQPILVQARAIRERIGYSDNIMDDEYLNNEYKDVSIWKYATENVFLLSWNHFSRIQSAFIVAAYQFCEKSLWIPGFYEFCWRIYGQVLIALISANPPVSLCVGVSWATVQRSTLKTSYRTWSMCRRNACGNSE